MHAQAKRLSDVVGNLLDMARLNAGDVQLRKEWQPLEEVVGSALKSVHTAIAGHRVVVGLPDDLPLLEFDASLIERVLSNLLENAAKYTPPASAISIGAARSGHDAVEIRVEDDGPGLPLGKEEDIFKKFERGRPADASQGVGLGLAICRAIVEAHGGEIRAENRPSGGARFIFTLPREIPPAPTESVPERAQPLP